MFSEKLTIHPASAHGDIQAILPNIWFVQGEVKMPMLFPPMRISRSMTIIRNPENNELSIINSMRLQDQAMAELDKLGKVAHIIRIGGFHGRDDAFYKQRYQAKLYAIKGQVYTKAMTKIPDHSDKGYLQADEWLDEQSTLPIPNASLKIFSSSQPPEAILLLKQDGGIAITADALQNTALPDKYHNWFARIMMKKMGFFKPYAIGAGWVQFAKPTPEDIRSVLDLEFEHVLPGHGIPVINNAKEKYRPAMEGPIKGCHE